MEKHGRLIAYNFYYYTSNGVFTLNYKTYTLYGLMLSTCLIVISLDSMYIANMYTELITSIILLIVIIVIIKLLSPDNLTITIFPPLSFIIPP